MYKSTIAAALLLSGSLATSSVLAQAQRIEADVVTADANALQLRSHAGNTVTVMVDDSTRLSARSASTVDKIVPGAFIGTTAVPGADGTLTAVEGHIFAESMRGTGEGHRPMAGAPGSTMTNATVSGATRAVASKNTMTNATVASEAGSAKEGLKLKLTYAGGEQVVTVAPGTPVELIEPATRSALVPGAHVLVFAEPRADGVLFAQRINIGKNGYVPTR